MTWTPRGVTLGAVVLLAASVAARGGQTPAAAPTTALIEQLGSLDLKTRTTAAQTIRRMAPTLIVPALQQAARENKDGYVRYQALVMLSGFGEGAASDTMRQVMGDKNDRLRAVAFGWFEHHPQPAVTPALVAALTTEQSEFVRPVLTRAVAASGDDARVSGTLIPLVPRGVNFFRAAVIESLGDYHVAKAAPSVLEVAKLDGPLQENAIEALGKLGDKSVVPWLQSVEATVAPAVQPAVAAALCQLDVDCDRQMKFILDALTASMADSSRSAITEASAHALAVLAVAGHKDALTRLLDIGDSAKEPARSPVVLAVGYVALRQPTAILAALKTRTAARQADLSVLRDAFDMLSDEDFERECFYADVRRAYWEAAEASAERQTAQAVITALEF
jgi:HEAT repeat protein